MLVTQDKNSPNPAPKKKGKGSRPQCASTKDWRRTPSGTKTERPVRIDYYPDRLGTYARDLDKYVNRLEKDVDKESKKRSEALQKEIKAANRKKLKLSYQKARRKGEGAAKDAAKEASLRKVQKLEAQVKAMKKKLAVYEPGTLRGDPAKKPTRHTMVGREKGNMRRTPLWRKRSNALRKAGIAIHGDEEGYWCDLLAQVTYKRAKIDQLLDMPKVKDRCENTVFALFVFVLMI